MSLLSDYERRTAWKYEPIRGSFPAADSLSEKVEQDGSYRPFRGTTVVFRPGSSCLQAVQLMQRALYCRLEGTGMLASPLPASTIHMTLHDLISPEKSAAAAKEDYEAEMDASIRAAVGIVEGIRREYAGRRISMTADRIVNMVSKSLVLMLRPKTEEDYELLQELYRRFDPVVSLPYPLTPHITLAYFRPGMLDGDKLGEAVEHVQILPERAPEFDFYPEALTVQVFRDMQSYQDIGEGSCEQAFPELHEQAERFLDICGQRNGDV